MFTIVLAGAAALIATTTPVESAPPDVATLAAEFGARVAAESASLSPDGKRRVYVAPG